jgi:hypothetical protein
MAERTELKSDRRSVGWKDWMSAAMTGQRMAEQWVHWSAVSMDARTVVMMAENWGIQLAGRSAHRKAERTASRMERWSVGRKDWTLAARTGRRMAEQWAHLSAVSMDVRTAATKAQKKAGKSDSPQVVTKVPMMAGQMVVQKVSLKAGRMDRRMAGQKAA